jgi:hypothetical protein
VKKTVWSCSLSMSSYLVAGLGAVHVLHTRAVPLFCDAYPIACFTTICQLHEGLRSLDHGTSLRSPIGLVLSGYLSMAAVRHSCTPAILIDTDGRRCSNSNRPPPPNQSPTPFSDAFHNWLLLSIRVVVSASCYGSDPTARYRSPCNLPCLSAICQDDSAG